ncbi:MAG: hemolysin family protein [Polyangiales bacterium]
MFALGLTLIFVVLNGFFVAAEFALVKLRATQLDRLSKRSDPAAVTVVEIAGRLDRYLSATQLGITLASLGLGWVGEPAVTHLLERAGLRLGLPPSSTLHSVAVVVGFTVLTGLHILFGELLPKLLAIQSAEGVALAVGRPLRLFHFLTYPALLALNAASSLLLRAMGRGSITDIEGALSEEEILGILTQAYAKGRLSKPKRQLIERVMQFSERSVRQIMVPRVDVSWLSADLGVDEAVDRARSLGFTRYPLVEGNDLDRVVGYVNVKDLLLAARAPDSLRGAMREAMMAPETLGLFDLMREMQRRQVPLAVVVDEYGGTSGIATLEDVLEEIVGDIRDEHDDEEPGVSQRADGSWTADGLLTLHDLRDAGVDLGDIDADTIGGAVLETLGRLARAGDLVRIGEWEIRVDTVRRRRVARVQIRRRAPSEAGQDRSGDGA